MEEIQALMQGFSVALSPTNVALMFIGILLGVIFELGIQANSQGSVHGVSKTCMTLSHKGRFFRA